MWLRSHLCVLRTFHDTRHWYRYHFLCLTGLFQTFLPGVKFQFFLKQQCGRNGIRLKWCECVRGACKQTPTSLPESILIPYVPAKCGAKNFGMHWQFEFLAFNRREMKGVQKATNICPSGIELGAPCNTCHPSPAFCDSRPMAMPNQYHIPVAVAEDKQMPVKEAVHVAHQIIWSGNQSWCVCNVVCLCRGTLRSVFCNIRKCLESWNLKRACKAENMQKAFVKY